MDYNVGVPIFLSDGVLKLDNLGIGGEYNYSLKILKMRGTKITGEDVYGYKIIPGIGMYVSKKRLSLEFERPVNDQLFEKAKEIIKTEAKGDLKDFLLDELRVLRAKAEDIQNMEEIINHFLRSHGLSEVRYS
jgi:hypothetical protein